MGIKKKEIWQAPWGYAESFSIAFALMILGFAISYIEKSRVSTVQWPFNLYIGISFTVLLIVLSLFLKKRQFVKWLSSMPAAISAICLFTFLVLIMGFIPQSSLAVPGFSYRIGITDILSSHAFLFAQIYFLTTLGMITLRRSFPFKRKNIAFFVSHFGLWLTLFAGALGAGDIQKVKIKTNMTDFVFSGQNQRGKIIKDLGIAIKLKEFSIEEYSPKAYIIDNKSGDVLNDNIFYLEKDNSVIMGNWEIEVTEFYKYSVGIEKEFHPIYDIGSSPAAYIVAKNLISGKTTEGWISCGSFRYPGAFLNLSEKNLLVMADPEPKEYSSELKILTPSGETIETSVEVNNPATAGGWKIYQIDYDQQKGRWSEISILELVRDPWLPIVYIGIFLMIIGAIHMFWIGNNKKVG